MGSNWNASFSNHGEKVVETLYEVKCYITDNIITDDICYNNAYRCIKICYTVLEEHVSDVVAKTTTTPTKVSGQKSAKSMKKELPKITKHNHGNFINNLHYVKLFTTVKNVYAVYQVTSRDLI